MLLVPTGAALVGAILPYTGAAHSLGFTPVLTSFFLILFGMVVTYLVMVELAKARFYRIPHERTSRLPCTHAERLERSFRRRASRFVRFGPKRRKFERSSVADEAGEQSAYRSDEARQWFCPKLLLTSSSASRANTGLSALSHTSLRSCPERRSNPVVVQVGRRCRSTALKGSPSVETKMTVTEIPMMVGTTGDGGFVAPVQSGSFVDVKPRYDNFIGGHRLVAAKGPYMKHISPYVGPARMSLAEFSTKTSAVSTNDHRSSRSVACFKSKKAVRFPRFTSRFI